VTPVESSVVQQVEPQGQYQTQAEPQEQYETQPEPQPDVQAETQPVAHHGAHSHPVPESVNGNQQPVPTVVPEPPASTEPQREPVAVPVPREVRESAWDAHTNDPGERRPATVAPDGSAWS